MRVLIACEFSGRVRSAFRRRGHDAWSCDLIEAEDGSPYHYLCDALTILGDRWDLLIAHPPCTYLTRTGAQWWSRLDAGKQEAELAFVRALMAAPVPSIAIENPPGAIGTRIRPADQYIQPWQFGHPETKATGLWLKGLVPLRPTRIVWAEMLALPLAERARVHRVSPSADRWKTRSRTYEGIAEAMAEQWASRPGQRDLFDPDAPPLVSCPERLDPPEGARRVIRDIRAGYRGSDVKRSRRVFPLKTGFFGWPRLVPYKGL